MDWILAASAWAKAALENVGMSPAALPMAFLLGLVSAVASACCTLPVLGAVVGYSGTRRQLDRKSNLLNAAFFMLGSTLALIILGVVAGFLGQVAQSSLGQYWQLFAGIVAISFGLATLNLLPFKLPHRQATRGRQSKGLLGAAMFGVIMGGAVSVCSLACNPGIFIVLGATVLQGYNLWAMSMLAVYAIGFSLPLAVLMLGVSFGKMAAKAKTAETVVRIGAGVLLIITGFYFIGTF